MKRYQVLARIYMVLGILVLSFGPLSGYWSSLVLYTFDGVVLLLGAMLIECITKPRTNRGG